jgi:hypothetical protein
MQKQLFALTLFMLFLITPAVTKAQEVAKVELFGGYQFARLDSSVFSDDAFHGWSAALQGNFTDSWSVVGEVSGVFNNDDQYFYLLGPRYTKRMSKGNVFAHALLGGANGSSTRTITITPPPVCDPTAPTCPPATTTSSVVEAGFAMAFGGGADLNLGDRVAWRVGQVDYVYSHQGDSGNHFRYSTGFVIRFGKR